MADVKWIKVTTDVFDDEKILLIESLPEADSIIVIWFKLLCLAGKQNNSGVFMMGNRIPYTDRMLATIFRRKEATVQLALQTFEQFGMIELIDNVITIPNWGKHQSLDQIENRKQYMRGYMKEYREKQKAIASADTETAELPYAIWQDVKKAFNNECAYCGKIGQLEQEHVVPFAKGGTLTVENIVPACRRCNASKGTKDFEEWYINSSAYSEERYNRIRQYLNGGFRKCLHKPLHKATVNEAEEDIEKELELELELEREKKKNNKPIRHKYGEYGNVLLSDTDLEKLKNEFPVDWEDRIENLSAYIASTGKSYKNHLATIRNWARKDSKQAPTPAKQTRPNTQASTGNPFLDLAIDENLI